MKFGFLETSAGERLGTPKTGWNPETAGEHDFLAVPET
jgi:hypothetical protein